MTGAASSAESQVVFNLFSGTVNSSPSVREQAESQLKLVKKGGVFQQMCVQFFNRPVNRLDSVPSFCK